MNVSDLTIAWSPVTSTFSGAVGRRLGQITPRTGTLQMGDAIMSLGTIFIIILIILLLGGFSGRFRGYGYGFGHGGIGVIGIILIILVVLLLTGRI